MWDVLFVIDSILFFSRSGFSLCKRNAQSYPSCLIRGVSPPLGVLSAWEAASFRLRGCHLSRVKAFAAKLSTNERPFSRIEFIALRLARRGIEIRV